MGSHFLLQGILLTQGLNLGLLHCRLILYALIYAGWGLPGISEGKESACNVGDWVGSLGWEDPLEKEMGTHSSTLAWKILWTEEPDRLQSLGSPRVGHN